MPDVAGNLKDLKTLRLSGNKFTVRSLFRLFQCAHEWQEFPAALVQLRNLTQLDLSLNQIPALPVTITNMIALQHLNLGALVDGVYFVALVNNPVAENCLRICQPKLNTIEFVAIDGNKLASANGSAALHNPATSSLTTTTSRCDGISAIADKRIHFDFDSPFEGTLRPDAEFGWKPACIINNAVPTYTCWRA